MHIQIRNFIIRRGRAVFAMAALTIMFAQNIQAAEFLENKIELHGYGHQGFLLTDGNKYLHAGDQGTFNNNALALLFSVKATEDVTIWAQLFSNLNDFRLDWAFVDYQLGNDFQLRAGQIKTPIGIYNEIRDIKYLQLSTLEPLIYQEELRMTHEAFRGASMLYNLDVAGGNLELDIYGGQQVNFDENPELEFNQLIGTRVTYKTALDGLSIMGSAYSSKAEEKDTTTGATLNDGRNNFWMASVNYQNNDIDLKAEYAEMKMLDEKLSGYYLQGGYTFFDKLTPFIRYDYLTTDKDQKSDPAFYQKDITFGVGYKFNSNVAAKIEDHIVRGFALPFIADNTGTYEKNWNLFAASINFMF